MSLPKISLEKARRIAINAQLLTTPQRDPLAVIGHLGYVQIDSIHVVERAHHHTLWARVPSYRSGDVERLVEDKKVFEYWGHAMSYLPMEDFRFYLKRKEAFPRSNWGRRLDEETRDIQGEVLAVIKAEGAKKSTDFEHPKKGGTWWNWKPAKRALEVLFDRGELMVAKRDRFQRVYDLTERVLPTGVDITPPSDQEIHRFLITRALRALGLATAKEILGYIHIGDKVDVPVELEDMVQSGELVQVSVEDQKESYFVFAQTVDKDPLIPERLHILSPFDNFVINRARIKRLFNFKYSIECYLPASKRKYGYFSLPILWKDRFLGRIDCKADRKAKVLLVRHLSFEDGFANKERDNPALQQRLGDFAEFNGCEEVRFETTVG